MILVIFGTSRYRFDRLAIELDKIAFNFDEEITVQRGEFEYGFKNIKNHFNLIIKKEMEDLYKKSRLLICHSGMGTIRMAVKFQKPIIIVPRRRKYYEHFDDHQIEIARELEKEGISVIYDINKLHSSIKSNNKIIEISNDRDNFIKTLKDHLKSFDRND